jgi:hypothetical protein
MENKLDEVLKKGTVGSWFISETEIDYQTIVEDICMVNQKPEEYIFTSEDLINYSVEVLGLDFERLLNDIIRVNYEMQSM